MGLKEDPLIASTMAFATICLARLLHGLNCRSQYSLSKIGLLSNPSSLYAFFIGFILLHIILFIPTMHHLFIIHPISITQLLCIYGFSFIPTLMIQTRKMISEKSIEN